MIEGPYVPFPRQTSHTLSRVADAEVREQKEREREREGERERNERESEKERERARERGRGRGREREREREKTKAGEKKSVNIGQECWGGRGGIKKNKLFKDIFRLFVFRASEIKEWNFNPGLSSCFNGQGSSCLTLACE